MEANTVSFPYLSHSSRKRRSPVRRAATCAHMSPRERSGKRTFALITSTSASFNLPSSNNFTQRSEEHTSELQSRENLVCRLLLEKKKKKKYKDNYLKVSKDTKKEKIITEETDHSGESNRLEKTINISGCEAVLF